MKKYETHADIMAEMRDEKPGLQNAALNANNRHLAKRLEAAHKRELEAKDSTIQALSSQLQQARSATAEKSSVVGDAAKLREALCKLAIASQIFLRTHSSQSYLDTMEALDKARAALAAPPRNCDRPECKDIRSAMQVYRRECCVDVGPCFERRPGAMREADWLLATAERKGGKDGSK